MICGCRVEASLNEDTKFPFPTPDTTLTIPSTARKIISVGAYNSRLLSYAEFSGRGYTRVTREIKPDLAAPGWISLPLCREEDMAPGPGLPLRRPLSQGRQPCLWSGGSSGGQDPYLYGEKVKAYLRRGARRLSGGVYPNPETGFGFLCQGDSFPV